MKHQNFDHKPAGERPAGRHRWKDNMNLKEAEWKGVVGWIHVAQDTLFHAVCSFLLKLNLQCGFLRLF
jgi:hypothetical protein